MPNHVFPLPYQLRQVNRIHVAHHHILFLVNGHELSRTPLLVETILDHVCLHGTGRDPSDFRELALNQFASFNRSQVSSLLILASICNLVIHILWLLLGTPTSIIGRFKWMSINDILLGEVGNVSTRERRILDQIFDLLSFKNIIQQFLFFWGSFVPKFPVARLVIILNKSVLSFSGMFVLFVLGLCP